MSENAPRVMVIDDDAFILIAIKQTLSMHGYEVDIFDKPVEAVAHVSPGALYAVIADVKMPKMDGLALLKKVRETDPELPVIFITGHGDIPLAVTALKEGAYDFLEKPVDESVLLISLRRAVEKMELVNRNRTLLKQLEEGRSKFGDIVGHSPPIQKIYRLIELSAGEDYPVLITGETGTGKELVARAIHDLSRRGRGIFSAINMAAIPESMLESELFGHEAGAFTGASKRSVGKFEYAGEGTIFLDEICSMPLALQGKLLRVIEEKSFQRLGSNESIPVRARIIVASNRDLKKEVEKGSFRADLFFRLNVIPIEAPPLRERREDIPLLAAHFMDRYSGGKVKHLPGEVLRWMLSYEWPGNVRELENFVKQRCLLGEGFALEEKKRLSGRGAEGDKRKTLRECLDAAEKEFIARMLHRLNGQITSVSAALGISRKSLYEKMKKHKLSKKDYKG